MKKIKTKTKNIGKKVDREQIVGFLFIVLPILFYIAFTIVPFISVISNSFFSMTYTKNSGYIAFQNYETIWADASARKSIFNSLYYMIAAVVQVALALLLAVLTENAKYRSGFKAVLFLPYLLNGIAIGYIFRIFFSHGSILDSVIGIIGVPKDILPYWLRDQNFNNWMLASVSVWRYLGLSYVIFIGAITSINPNCLKASSLDGAGKIRQFQYVVWPSIKKVVLINLLLSVVSSLSEFEIPYAVASGGANGTGTYMTLIYHMAFNERKIGLASALTVTLLCQLVLMCCALVALYRLLNNIGERYKCHVSKV